MLDVNAVHRRAGVADAAGPAGGAGRGGAGVRHGRALTPASSCASAATSPGNQWDKNPLRIPPCVGLTTAGAPNAERYANTTDSAERR